MSNKTPDHSPPSTPPSFDDSPTVFQSKWLNRLTDLFIALAVIATGLTAAIFVFANSGIPFVEGTKSIFEGEAYGFEIGMNRTECLSTIQSIYNEPDHFLRASWETPSPVEPETREMLGVTAFGQVGTLRNTYETLVSDLDPNHPVLKRAERWTIDLPESWIHRVGLWFLEERLVEISRTRWLFERP